MSPRKPKPGQSLADLEPELCKEWSPRNDLPPTSYTRGSSQKVWWICSEGHEWEATINSRTSKGTGCPICVGQKVLQGFNDLLTLEPELCLEWDYSKNKLGPENYTRGTTRKVWWICDKNHEWSAAISDRTGRRRGCPICAGKQVLQGFNDLLTLEPELCQEWDYSKNKLGPENYTRGSNKSVWWICDKNHEWAAVIDKRINMKSGCPYCSGRLPILYETDLLTLEPELCLEWDYSKNKLGPENYMRGSGKKVWWICAKNHEWEAVIVNRTRLERGCPICAGQKVLIGFNDLLTLEPELCKEWNYSKNKLGPEKYTRHSGKKIFWCCEKEGHRWSTSINSRTGKDRTNCPICAGKQVLQGFNDLLTLDPELCKEWNFSKNKLGPEKYTRSSGKKVWWICDKNHEWAAVIAKRINMKSGCSICTNSGTSRIEQDLCASLNGISSKVPNTSDKSKNSSWKVDVLLGDTVIEFDGAYFHSLKGAYTRDRNKTLDLLSQGYNVIRIRDCYPPYKLKSLRIKHKNYYELFWSHDESTYPSELPDELLDKIREICYS